MKPEVKEWLDWATGDLQKAKDNLSLGYWDLNYPVDFLGYTPEEFNKLRKRIIIVKHAVEEGIEI